MSTTLRERAEAFRTGRLRWVQGTPKTPGTACVAFDADGDTCGASWALGEYSYDIVAAAIGAPVIMDWNDEDGRTLEEVVAVLHRAADFLREPPLAVNP